MLPVVPLCPAPKPSAPVVELLRGAATFIPKPPLPAGPADTPNVKGNKVVLPNTELLVPLLVVWVIAPKPEVVATKKGETAVVLPKAGWVLERVSKTKAVGFRPRKPDHAVLPKTGWGGIGAELQVGPGLLSFPKERSCQSWGPVLAGSPHLLSVSGSECVLWRDSGIGWDGGPGARTKGNVEGWGGSAAKCQCRLARGNGGRGREGATEATETGGAAASSCLDGAGQGLAEGDGCCWSRRGQSLPN